MNAAIGIGFDLITACAAAVPRRTVLTNGF